MGNYQMSPFELNLQQNISKLHNDLIEAPITIYKTCIYIANMQNNNNHEFLWIKLQ